MNIQEMSLEQLKALAYDEGRKLEIARQNLNVINARIVEKEKAADEGKDS